MIITTEYIKSLNPCPNRLDNYLKHYPSFEGHLTSFLDLENITYADKVWVFFRSIPKTVRPLVAADIAELVLHVYESEYPNDYRPREAISAARRGNATYATAYATYATYAAASAFAPILAADCAFATYAAYAAHAASATAHAEREQLVIMKKWITGEE